MRNSRHDVGGRLGDAAAENPGRAALLSLVGTPLAMRAGRVALGWARRADRRRVRARGGGTRVRVTVARLD